MKANAVGPNPQGIDRYAKFLGLQFSLVNLGLFVFLVISQHQITILVRQVSEARIKTLIFRFAVVRQICPQGHRVDGSELPSLQNILLPQVLKVNILTDTIEVGSGIALIIARHVADPGRDAVNCFVCQVLGCHASATDEDFYQSAANLFVPDSRENAISIKPIQQTVKGILS